MNILRLRKRYRVKEENGRFYPEFRTFFIWHRFKWIHKLESYTISFDNNKHAAHFVNMCRSEGHAKHIKWIYEIREQLETAFKIANENNDEKPKTISEQLDSIFLKLLKVKTFNGMFCK